MTLRTRMLAAVLAVTLAACGASGSVDEETSDAPNEQTSATADDQGSDPATDEATTGGSDETAPEASGDPIVVVTLLSVTGPLANLGDKMRQGMELAVEEINADGGIDGRPLEWVFFDPAGDTSTAVDQTRRLIQEEEVDVIVGGGSSSGIALAMKQITEEAGVLFMATEGARAIVQPVEESAHTFKATFNDTEILERTITYWQEQGVSRVAFMPDSSGFGQSALEVLEELAPEAEIELSVESYDPAATDLTPQLSRLAEDDPDAYLAWTATPSGVVFINNAAQLGLNETATIQHGFGFVDERFMEQAGDSSVGTILTSPKLPAYDQLPDDDAQKPVITDFVEAFETSYGEMPNVFAGQTYDGMMLVADAISQAGATDGATLASTLEDMEPYTGVTGTYDYSPDDHGGLAAEDAAIIEWTGSRFELAE